MLLHFYLFADMWCKLQEQQTSWSLHGPWWKGF